MGTLKKSYTPPFENLSSRVPSISESRWYPTWVIPCEATGILFMCREPPFFGRDASSGRLRDSPSGHSLCAVVLIVAVLVSPWLRRLDRRSLFAAQRAHSITKSWISA